MNKRITNLILFFFLTNILNCFANKDRAFVCLDTLQKQSINTSDFIFLGKLNGIDTINKTLNFKVIEEFKGDLKSKLIYIQEEDIQKEECISIFFSGKSLWIVYLNQNADSTYVLNLHGLSRSINRPELIPAYKFPPPPPLNYEKNGMFTYNDKWIDFRITALKDWYVELELLRDYKRNNLKDIKMNSFDFKLYFYSSLLFILFCLSLIFYLLFKLKKTNR